MTGYTRQSASDIQNGQEITAQPLIAEFNRMESAFNTTTGHSHDGTSDNGPKINLTTSVTGYLPDVHGGVGGKNNTVGAAAPGNSDDASQGYSTGSLWMDISGTATQIYICLDNTTGAAQWGQLGLWDPATLQLKAPSGAYSIGTDASRPDIFVDQLDANRLFMSSNVLQVAHSINMPLSTMTINCQSFTVVRPSFFESDVTFEGDVTLGDASSDTITITGKINTDLLPVAGTENIGHPLSTTWANLYLNSSATIPTVNSDTVLIGTAPTYAGNLQVRGDLTVVAGFTPNPPPNGTVLGGNLTSNNITAQNDLTVAGNTTLGDTLASDIITLNAKVSSDILPSVDGADGTTGYDLGSSTDYFNELYVHDAYVSGNISVPNGTITGTINANSNTIQSVSDPQNAQDAATKAYVDNADAAKLNLSGGTMTGDISMDSSYQIRNLLAPVNASDAATKLYVDDSVANLVGSAPAALDTLQELAAAISDDASYSTTVTNLVASRLPLAGGTMSGDITMSSGATIKALPTPTLAGDAASKSYVDTQITSSVGNYLPLAGGTVTGDITLSSATITGLPSTPTASSEAASKAYVDAIAGTLTQVQNVYDQFDDRYLGSKSGAPALDNDGNALLVGALYWDSQDNALNVYGGTTVGWQAVGNNSFGKQSHSASSGQTTFNAPAYTLGMVEVYLNGLRLKETSDYTATDGATIVLTSAAAVNDEIEIIAYGSFEVANTYTQAQSDARYLQVGAVNTTLNNFIVGDGTNLSNKNPSDVKTILGISTTDDVTYNTVQAGASKINSPVFNDYDIATTSTSNSLQHLTGTNGFLTVPHTILRDASNNNNLSIYHPDNEYTGIRITPSGAYDEFTGGTNSAPVRGGEIALVAHANHANRDNTTSGYVSGVVIDQGFVNVSTGQITHQIRNIGDDTVAPTTKQLITEFGVIAQESSYNVTKTINVLHKDANTGNYLFDLGVANVFKITLTEDTTIEFTNQYNSSSTTRTIVFEIIQDSTDRTVTWPNGITWKDGVAPTPSSGSGKKDFIVLLEQGTAFYGFVAAQGL